MSKENPYKTGPSYYTRYKIQPGEFIVENRLLHPEACVVKYVLRHSQKGGKEDVKKAIHYLEMILQRDYNE